ncbi:MAG: alternative ribosome rescue aminoacyl-tRNA hydrolase ArfB [candidate division SR1 bacterium]|nr:alternative ribosome rescue aminoacyl-tRNA hydrolase ArfB [candidate division SR1 bacterium]
MNADEIIEDIINKELHFHFAKSGGPGGQNVNKRETKAELYFNINDSQNLTPEQKQRLIVVGGNMVHHEESILIMTCKEERYQNANKEKVTHHFRQLLEKILSEPEKRIATKIPKNEREGRIKEKKIASKIKQSRRIPPLDY